MWWKTTPDVSQDLRHLNERVDHLSTLHSNLADKVAETSREVRHFDLDMVGLEDKVKAFTGRISVRKRKDRKEPENDAPPVDLDQLIQEGRLSKWP